VVKIAQSLYREAPGMDVFRPDQKTPVSNFFLSGSYTKQVQPTYLLSAGIYFRYDTKRIFLTELTRMSMMSFLCFHIYHKVEFCFKVLHVLTQNVDTFEQDYIDSMEGATLSGRQTSARINEAGSELHDLRQRIVKIEANASLQGEPAKDELTFL